MIELFLDNPVIGCNCPDATPGWPLLYAEDPYLNPDGLTIGLLHHTDRGWTQCLSEAITYTPDDENTLAPSRSVTGEEQAAFLTRATRQAAAHDDNWWHHQIVQRAVVELSRADNNLDTLRTTEQIRLRERQVLANRLAALQLLLDAPAAAEIALRLADDWHGTPAELTTAALAIDDQP